MSDTWSELQKVTKKRLSLREKLAQRKRDRGGVLNLTTCENAESELKVEQLLLSHLSESSTRCVDLSDLHRLAVDSGLADVNLSALRSLLLKLEARNLVSLHSSSAVTAGGDQCSKLQLVVLPTTTTTTAADDVTTAVAAVASAVDGVTTAVASSAAAAVAATTDTSKQQQQQQSEDVLNLLRLPSAREKQTQLMGDEIIELLTRPTYRQRCTAEYFRSQGGAHVHEYCRHGTRQECERNRANNSGGGGGGGGVLQACDKVHFIRIVQSHTDESLGDCSFLNTCFHIKTCRYVHYQVDSSDIDTPALNTNRETLYSSSTTTATTITTVPQTKTLTSTAAAAAAAVVTSQSSAAIFGSPPTGNFCSQNAAGIVANAPRSKLYPPQWIQCDLRVFDMSVIGECAVIMADPPWDIHMELPYGTLSDDEMRSLNIPKLQKSGLFFLWVTGRAMELGRECLRLWGYERVDELIWVKTNQLQRLIRTGRTGHWLNHGKEHCLVAVKGDPLPLLNRQLDSDVMVAEVRATSHKPDEIYGLIERLSPGTRKLELFGRPHNAQPNWITLGNQLDGVNLCDAEIVHRFRQTYPDGNAMTPVRRQ